MKLTFTEITELAAGHNIPAALIQMVCNVEAPHGGHLPDKRPAILFEGHIFYALLDPKTRDQIAKANPDICYKTWTKKHYVGGAGEHERMARAAEINREAALKSASWGRPQILGNNYKAAGFATLQAFVNCMYGPEALHIGAMLNFIKSWPKQYNALMAIPHYTGTTDAEKVKDLIKRCGVFAACYNGEAYAQNQYDKKLAKEYLNLTNQAALAKLIKLK